MKAAGTPLKRMKGVRLGIVKLMLSEILIYLSTKILHQPQLKLVLGDLKPHQWEILVAITIFKRARHWPVQISKLAKRLAGKTATETKKFHPKKKSVA